MTYTLDGLNQHAMSDNVQYGDRLNHYIGASLEGLKQERSGIPFKANEETAAKFLIFRDANSKRIPTKDEVENAVAVELGKLRSVGKFNMNYSARFLLHYYRVHLGGEPLKLLEKLNWPIKPEDWLTQ